MNFITFFFFFFSPLFSSFFHEFLLPILPCFGQKLFPPPQGGWKRPEYISLIWKEKVVACNFPPVRILWQSDRPNDQQTNHQADLRVNLEEVTLLKVNSENPWLALTASSCDVLTPTGSPVNLAAGVTDSFKRVSWNYKYVSFIYTYMYICVNICL